MTSNSFYKFSKWSPVRLHVYVIYKIATKLVSIFFKNFSAWIENINMSKPFSDISGNVLVLDTQRPGCSSCWFCPQNEIARWKPTQRVMMECTTSSSMAKGSLSLSRWRPKKENPMQQHTGTAAVRETRPIFLHFIQCQPSTRCWSWRQ